MNSILLGASLIAYFLASVLYLANLHIRNRMLEKYGTTAVAIGFVLQSMRLVSQGIALGSPFATPPEAMFFLSWAIAAAYLVILARFRLPVVGALAVPLSVIALALAIRFRGYGGGEFVTSGWIGIHVYSIVASLSVFAVAFCCAVFYLVQNRLLKRKKLHGMFRKLPPLEMVDSLAYNLAAVGFPLLTLGIITGIVGVERATADPGESALRVTIAGLTWVIYAAYLLSRTAARWRGKRSNLILIAGAVTIALTTGFHQFV